MSKTKTIKFLETLTILIYISLIITIYNFHEPWFDEAQAWLIARDNSIFEIIWNICRYEGHPPIWYLLLYIPSHLGVPYEIGLKITNLIFIVLTVIIIVKKSPFPLLFRLLLPFTYFFFYQYGVISRCYSVLCFILFLIALVFPFRNRKPLFFSFLMIFLGGITVHGMLISLGIAIAWFIEICSINTPINIRIQDKIKLILMDRRLYSLVFWGLVNIFYVIILWPMPDKLTPIQKNSFIIMDTLFIFFATPLNSLMTDVWQYSSGDWPISAYFTIIAGIAFFIGFLIWAINKRISLYILLPYVFISLFLSIVYFSGHHSGIYLLLIIFSLWISSYSESPFQVPKLTNRIYSLFFNIIDNSQLIKSLSVLCIVLVFVVQIFWSIVALLNDIKLPYSESRAVATFIKKNHLEDKRIFTCYFLSNGKPTYSIMNIIPLPYFMDNIYYNLNFGNKNKSFITHKKYSENEVIEYINKSGEPEFIFDSRNSISLYPNIINPKNYAVIEIFEGYYFWKYRIQNNLSKFYIRKDLFREYPQFSEYISVETSQ